VCRCEVSARRAQLEAVAAASLPHARGGRLTTALAVMVNALRQPAFVTIWCVGGSALLHGNAWRKKGLGVESTIEAPSGASYICPTTSTTAVTTARPSWTGASAIISQVLDEVTMEITWSIETSRWADFEIGLSSILFSELVMLSNACSYENAAAMQIVLLQS